MHEYGSTVWGVQCRPWHRALQLFGIKSYPPKPQPSEVIITNFNNATELDEPTVRIHITPPSQPADVFIHVVLI